MIVDSDNNIYSRRKYIIGKINYCLIAIMLSLILIFSIIMMIYNIRIFNAWKKYHYSYNMSLVDSKKNVAFKYTTNIINDLSWDGQFMHFCGNAYLFYGDANSAIQCFNIAREHYSNPFMYENLGISYLLKKNSIIKNKESNDVFLSIYNNKAIDCMTFASDILPWRIKPKYYLMNIYYSMRDE